MAKKKADDVINISIDAFLRRVKMTEAEFCRQMGYQNRQNARHWRKAEYFVKYNKATGSVRLMKPETEFKSFDMEHSRAKK